MKDVKLTKQKIDDSTYVVVQSVKENNKKISAWVLGLIGLVIGFINGFWGGGGGMLCVPTLTQIVKLPEKKAHATAILVMLPLCIVSFVVYLFKGAIEWGTTLKVTVGFVIGGAIGALLLKNMSNNVLRIVFAVVIIASGIKLLI